MATEVFFSIVLRVKSYLLKIVCVLIFSNKIFCQTQFPWLIWSKFSSQPGYGRTVKFKGSSWIWDNDGRWLKVETSSSTKYFDHSFKYSIQQVDFFRDAELVLSLSKPSVATKSKGLSYLWISTQKLLLQIKSDKKNNFNV